jgi:hypothetical protein
MLIAKRPRGPDPWLPHPLIKTCSRLANHVIQEHAAISINYIPLYCLVDPFAHLLNFSKLRRD